MGGRGRRRGRRGGSREGELTPTPRVVVVGGGLAGSEATWQLAKRGVGVDLYEMRPVLKTPVHQTSDFAELVCSNSLRGNDLDQAAGILKEEMRRLDSLIIKVADEVRVPAGSALAVDRGLFAHRITEEINKLPGVVIHREELRSIPTEPLAIVATGPLTSDALAADIARFVGETHLHFYDAVSPVHRGGQHRHDQGVSSLEVPERHGRLPQLSHG